MNNLFGRNFKYESLTTPDYYKKFTDNDLNIQFLKASNELGIDYELDNLNILSSSITIEINGHIFKIGDSSTILNANFEDNINSGDFIFEINSNSNSFFGRLDNYVIIEIKNDIITNIKFTVNE